MLLPYTMLSKMQTIIIHLPPSPRSEGGKCGAVLAAEKVLKETGAEQIEVFEQRFKEKFGTLNCFELMNTGFDCSDFVGEAAAITEYLIDAKI